MRMSPVIYGVQPFMRYEKESHIHQSSDVNELAAIRVMNEWIEIFDGHWCSQFGHVEYRSNVLQILGWKNVFKGPLN